MKPQIQDFRIGNLVKCKISNDATIYMVMAIDGFFGKIMLDGARQGEWITVEKIKPIPLTAEWLERLGFVDDYEGEWNWAMDNEGWYFESNGSEVRFCPPTEKDQNEMRLGYSLKYVHQLQNLFHALTDEELTIKEKA